MRHVICHYHIFKNSGTSFDEVLTDTVGSRLVSFDGPFPFSVFDQDELLKVIRNHGAARAFSSHQIRLPVPVSLEVRILPVVFLRHPLLRIRSVYEFFCQRADQKQGLRRMLPGAARPGFTSRDEASSKKLDFAGWLREAVDGSRPLNNISNAQTQLLCGAYGRRGLMRVVPLADGGVIADIDQARRNLCAVELLARTEHFTADVARFAAPLADCGIEFTQRDRKPANTTSNDIFRPLEARLAALREQIGDALYSDLEMLNRQDLQLYDEVCKRLG
ncbi:MAG: hypothetical protein ABR578_06390 [Chromatocurvus sp.]